MTTFRFHVVDGVTGVDLGNVLVSTQYQRVHTDSSGWTPPMDFSQPYWTKVYFTLEGYTPHDMTLRGGGPDQDFEVQLQPIYVEPPLRLREEREQAEEEEAVTVVTVPAAPVEEPPEPTIPTTGNLLIDPIIQALWPIARGFISLLQWLGKVFTAPAESALISIVDTITSAIRPGTPRAEIQKRVVRLTREYRKRLEQLSKRAVVSSPELELAYESAETLLQTLLATQVGTEIGATVADNLQPLRRMGIPDAAARTIQTLGMTSLASSIVNMPAEIGVLQPLRYYYNREYTPLIPSLSDLITMLVREVITPEQYQEYAAWHGESPEWAQRRWEAHWVLPARTWIDDAYHRGIITEDEWRRYYVWHDFKPEPRPGISKSDIEILAPLRKTLIPRVDLRRGWEYGVLTDEELERRYEMLGYEDDAPVMTEIQKRVALTAEINMLRREYLAWYERGLMTDEELDEAFRDLERLRPPLWYWKALARLRRARRAREPLPTLPEMSPEEVEKLAEEAA